MAQKEDILEQIVEEYLTHEGYFVQHNIRYRPKEFKQTPSDIDVIAINPNLKGSRRVFAVNVKSWQGGFDFGHQLRVAKIKPKTIRELKIPEWSKAFCDEIENRTGQRQFTYVLAVTHSKGDKAIWENNIEFVKNLEGNPIVVMSLREMVEKIERQITTTLAATDIGRTLQLFKAAGLRPVRTKPTPSPEAESDE